MNNSLNNVFKEKLEQISNIIDKLGIESTIIQPKDDIIFLLLSIPPENNISRDTQLYYIPIDENNDKTKFLIQIVSSFDIFDKDIPLSKLQTICDIINAKTPMGTLFIDHEDKGLYCRYTMIDVNKDELEETLKIILDIYIMTLSMTCNLIFTIID